MTPLAIVKITTGQAGSSRYFSTGYSSVTAVILTVGEAILCKQITPLSAYLFLILFFFLEFAEGDFADFGGGEFVAEFVGGGESVNWDVAL